MNEIIQYLKKQGKFEPLLSRWNEQQDEDIRFEILFAYWCEQRGLTLRYEVNVNPENDKSVDFQFITESGISINIELVRPDLNKGIRDQLDGDVLQGYLLTSNHEDPDFRTCAQQIKLQWALLEKAEKFAPFSDNTINIIAVDCSNIHAGMFDHHDLGMAMYGYPGNPIWQEYWGDQKLIGIWEDGYNQRNSDIFCDRVSSVIFLPKQKIEILEDAIAALNPLKSDDHRQKILDELKIYPSFVDVKVVQ